MPTGNNQKTNMRVTTSQYETSGKNCQIKQDLPVSRGLIEILPRQLQE